MIIGGIHRPCASASLKRCLNNGATAAVFSVGDRGFLCALHRTGCIERGENHSRAEVFRPSRNSPPFLGSYDGSFCRQSVYATECSFSGTSTLACRKDGTLPARKCISWCASICAHCFARASTKKNRSGRLPLARRDVVGAVPYGVVVAVSWNRAPSRPKRTPFRTPPSFRRRKPCERGVQGERETWRLKTSLSPCVSPSA